MSQVVCELYQKHDIIEEAAIKIANFYGEFFMDNLTTANRHSLPLPPRSSVITVMN